MLAFVKTLVRATSPKSTDVKITALRARASNSG